MIDTYILYLIVLGVAGLGMAWIPSIVLNKPISYTIVYVIFGMLLFLLPINLPSTDPLKQEYHILRLSEFGVIISLMGSGLKINRRFTLKNWAIPLKLVFITMIICIGAAAFLGWWAIGLAPASALLLGAALAPTDPVLAADVQVGPPSKKKEDHVRFSLTAEAGLNDGMAFPFTWLAVMMAIYVGSDESWIGEWIWKDVFFRSIVGIGMGYIFGKALAYLIFYLPEKTKFPKIRDGFVAISSTLIIYGITEVVEGYGFLAVFFAGVTLGNYEREHSYHVALHDFTDQIERLLMVVLLLLLGGSIVNGILDHLTWHGAIFSLIFLFVIRPLGSMLAMVGEKVHWKEKITISFFGIKGIGSFFYLSFGLHHAYFEDAPELWSIIGFTILISIIIHGISASPVMRYLDLQRVGEEGYEPNTQDIEEEPTIDEEQK